MKAIIFASLIVIIFCICITLIQETFVVYRESMLNSKEYKVQEYTNGQRAADLLAIINKNIRIIAKYMKQKYPVSQRVNRMIRRLDELEIEEAPHEEDSSSYTINKGELMALCLRKKNENKHFHNMQTLMFVVIHEMAHVMSVSEGHTKEFMENFKFILKEAEETGIYKPQNYQNEPIIYCGVKVTHNPYYNH